MTILSLGFPISSTPLLIPARPSGKELGEPACLLAAGADRMHLWRVDQRARARRMPDWPQRGRGPFASSPAAVDLDGDGELEIVAGSDDDFLYAWKLNGRLLRGFPVRTGGDVYSSPLLIDLNGDGRPEIVFGSDDGGVHAVTADGVSLPGFPFRTGGFVAASPVAADLDGDGRPEIVVGSWDRKLYVIDAEGRAWGPENGHPGWPLPMGSVIWSSALVADLDGDGEKEIAVAAERLHVVDLQGRPKPGWPQSIGGFTVSAPVAGDLDGSGKLSVVIGGARLHAFDSAGRARRGFPVDLGGHVWVRPLVRDMDGDGRAEIYAGAWSGGFFGIDGEGRLLPGFPVLTRGPIFGGAAAWARPDCSGEGLLAFGSWDGCLHVISVRSRAHAKAAAEGVGAAGIAPVASAGEAGSPASIPTQDALPLMLTSLGWSIDPDPPMPHGAFFLTLDGLLPEAIRFGQLFYRRPDGSDHATPLLASAGKLRAIIEPLPAGAQIPWHLVLEGGNGAVLRWPEQGAETLRIGTNWRARIRRVAGALRSRIRAAFSATSSGSREDSGAVDEVEPIRKTRQTRRFERDP